MLSDFRSDFGTRYGVQIVDGPFKGLLSRAVVVVDPQGKIVYEQQGLYGGFSYIEIEPGSNSQRELWQ